MVKVLEVVIVGPLESCVEDFAAHMAALGYTSSTIQHRMRLVAHLSRWCVAEGVELSALDPDMISRFVIVRRASHRPTFSVALLEPLLSMLRSTRQIPPASVGVLVRGPVDAVLDRWSVFLQHERGLQPSTIRYYVSLSRPFLLSRHHDGVVDFAGIDAVAVAGFVRDTLPGMSLGSAQLTVTAVRALLRFLFSSGLIGADLSGVVASRAGYRDAGLPKWLTSVQVAALLAAVGGHPLTDARDRAMLLLLVRLGLRAGEVAGLQLDDIDWRAGTLRIVGKGNQTDTLPIPVDVGQALAAHLQRPRHPAMSGRSVFHTSLAPYRPMTAETLKAVVSRAGRRAGLGTLGAHRLRHTVATATINAGASLEEVGQLLRHRHAGSTTIYAKVDLSRLTMLVRPWPGGAVGVLGRGTQS